MKRYHVKEISKRGVRMKERIGGSKRNIETKSTKTK